MIKINGEFKESTIYQPDEGAEAGLTVLHNRQLYEPQRTNDFEFIITIDGITKLKKVNSDEYLSPANQEYLKIALEGAFIPTYSSQVLTVRRNNFEVKYAGLPQMGSGSITLNDYIGVETKQFMLAWRQAVANMTTGKVGLLDDYKIDCYVIEYTPDHQKVNEWVLYGCWPSTCNFGSWSHADGAVNKITCDIQYDMFKLNPPD